MGVDPITWAEQLARYPFIHGEAQWAVETLVEHARKLESENAVLRTALRRVGKQLMRERVLRRAAETTFAEEDVVRMSGLVECETCGFEMYDHPADPNDPYLTVTCNLERVKL